MGGKGSLTGSFCGKIQQKEVKSEANFDLNDDEDVEQYADAIPSYICSLHEFSSVPETQAVYNVS